MVIGVITTTDKSKVSPQEPTYAKPFIERVEKEFGKENVRILDFNVIMRLFAQKHPKYYQLLTKKQKEEVILYKRVFTPRSNDPSHEEYRNAIKILTAVIEEYTDISTIDGLAGPGDYYNTVKYCFNDNPHRLLFEQALFSIAVRRGIPIVGVCGTHQQLAYLSKANIDGKFADHCEKEERGDVTVHNTFLIPGTEMWRRLKEIDPKSNNLIPINSIHGQAVTADNDSVNNLREYGGLRISAVSVAVKANDDDSSHIDVDAELEKIVFAAKKLAAIRLDNPNATNDDITLDDIKLAVELEPFKTKGITLIVEANESIYNALIATTQWHTEFPTGGIINDKVFSEFKQLTEAYRVKKGCVNQIKLLGEPAESREERQHTPPTQKMRGKDVISDIVDILIKIKSPQKRDQLLERAFMAMYSSLKESKSSPSPKLERTCLATLEKVRGGLTRREAAS